MERDSSEEKGVKVTSDGEMDEKQCAKKADHYLKEYFSLTSIHGFKYLGESSTSFERYRLWWIFSLIMSFTCCFLLICKIYLKWKSSPVIVSFAATETPIYHMPFPAVTICPETKISADFFNYTEALHKVKDKKVLTRQEHIALGYFSLICNNQASVGSDFQLISTVDKRFFSFLKERTPDFLKATLSCSWMGSDSSCEDFFTPIILDEGICYTFNMLDRSDLFESSVDHFENFHKINISADDWDSETLTYTSQKFDAYPYRSLLAGTRAAFSITMSTFDKDIDYLCKDFLQGYRVLLHYPATIPRLSNQYFRIPLDESVLAAVTPVTLTTSDSLRTYSPVDKGCYYSAEKELKFFKVYSQQNCQLECLANFTKNVCNCTAFYMPRDKETPICGPGSYNCLKSVEGSLPFIGAVSKFQKVPLQKFQSDNSPIDCNCLPSCTSIDYNVEITQSEWDWRRQFRAFRIDVTEKGAQFDENKLHVSKLDIYFKTNQIIGLERHEIYGPTDFIANFGGLLGLFTGFSIVSLIEIVYFVSLRLWFNLKLGRWR